MKKEEDPQRANLETYQFLESLYIDLKKNPLFAHDFGGKLGITVLVHDKITHENFTLNREDFCEETGLGSCMVLSTTNLRFIEWLHLHSSGDVIHERSHFEDLEQMLGTVKKLVSLKVSTLSVV